MLWEPDSCNSALIVAFVCACVCVGACVCAYVGVCVCVFPELQISFSALLYQILHVNVFDTNKSWLFWSDLFAPSLMCITQFCSVCIHLLFISSWKYCNETNKLCFQNGNCLEMLNICKFRSNLVGKIMRNSKLVKSEMFCYNEVNFSSCYNEI